jgi:hypothetical protein
MRSVDGSGTVLIVGPFNTPTVGPSGLLYVGELLGRPNKPSFGAEVDKPTPEDTVGGALTVAGKVLAERSSSLAESPPLPGSPVFGGSLLSPLP